MARHLEQHGHAATHVAEIGLDQASDRDLRDYAAANDYVIVSKDEDMFQKPGSKPEAGVGEAGVGPLHRSHTR